MRYPLRMQLTAPLAEVVAQIADRDRRVDWSICIREQSGNVLASHNADRQLQTASIGKLLLLGLLSKNIIDGDINAKTRLKKTSVPVVEDSGLWQNLAVEELALEDIATLIASVSDNHATNVLLNYIGLDRVKEFGRSLNLENTALLDYVRGNRNASHPPALSVGSASELSLLLMRIDNGSLVSEPVSAMLYKWLATGVDLSMVASAFGLDPLAHSFADRGFLVINKTGTDETVRADTGSVKASNTTLSYAVIANWPSDAEPQIRDTVLDNMNSIGWALRSLAA